MPSTVKLPDNEEIQYRQYSYTIRNIEFTINRTTYHLEDGTCIYMIMRHDFLGRRFPITDIGLEVDSTLIEHFFKYKESAQLKLDIYEQELNSDNEVVSTDLYLRYTFNCVAAKDETSYITTPDISSKDDIDSMRKVQLLELYLIDMNMVNTFAQKISTIIEKCTKSEALQMCFTFRSIGPGIVIATPPQAEKVLPYVSLQLGDLIQNIMELYNSYGLYDSQPIIYYDYRNIYCLNSINPNIIIKRPREFGNVTFRILNQTDPSHNIIGSANLFAQKTHIINLQNLPSIYDTSERQTSTRFSTLISVSANGEIEQTTLENDVSKAEFIRSKSELTQAQHINEVMRGHIVNFSVNACGISFLKPYKIYRFDVGTQYADKGLSGHDYRLLGYTLEIRRNSPTQYIHTASITLQRPFDNDKS